MEEERLDEDSISIEGNRGREKSESMKRAEKIVKPRSLFYIQIEATGRGLSPTPIFQKLVNMDFNMEEVMKTSEIDTLLGSYGLNNVLKTAKRRYEKWFIKAGKRFPESSQIKCWEEHERVALLDFLRDITLDYFAISSHERVKYRNYMLTLMKRLKSYQKTEWIKQVNEILKEWSLK